MASVVLRILRAACFVFMAVRSDGFSLATGPAAAAVPAAPVVVARRPGKLNLTAILEKVGQFNTYLSLLKSTQVGSQLINSQQQGLTLLAPPDAAFAALKPGTLNALTDQDKVALLQYHALPSYYTLGQLQTVSNPVRTAAPGNGLFGMNFSSIGNNVNVSTGIVKAAISGPVYSQSPVAVYTVDKVLLPLGIFGPKPPAAAPAPEAGGPMIPPTVSPSSDGSASTTSGCGSRFVLSNGVTLALAVLSVGFVASL
ncbi:hypothetical protein SUGI_0770690 [Cryptomeria japonica]|uniref:fasciclin-like arabinogalactan protein 11 n=1 Tax=Cryptomeria japonica TaxID=3369 RepID=UPI0024149ED2|nr:fasciclin-like arabinogalactan protein 11 [Cryptomeria japonica]GLJ37878.1 hypothetical protein SUGI_0770690 [Cryptomeria japonica]